MIEFAGVVTTVLPYIYYKRSEKQLNEGYYQHSSLLLAILTAFISVLCLFFIAYFMMST
jgi:putative membrane protein